MLESVEVQRSLEEVRAEQSRLLAANQLFQGAQVSWQLPPGQMADWRLGSSSCRIWPAPPIAASRSIPT